MLNETKIVRVTCDMGSCDVTQQFDLKIEDSSFVELHKEGWNIIKNFDQQRFICPSCFNRELEAANPVQYGGVRNEDH